MNILMILRQQHRKVEELFAQMDDNVNAFNIQRAADIRSALSLHAKIEETIFYPELAQEKATKKFAKHAEKEHNQIKGLLNQWSVIDARKPEWNELSKKIKETVLHHVKEEEEKMFPVVQEVFSEARLSAMGDKVIDIGM